ncbi:MAG TPA: MFS transporter [Aquificaceae bacterium]|nr:MFS transporter [Aquificaceae bacterium]
MLSPQEKKVITGITFAVVARMLGLFLLLPVLSPYVSTLEGSTPVLTGVAVGIYGLTQALLQIPFGYLSDIYGRKPIITLGFLAYILGSVLGGLAGSVWSMIIARFLQGAGAISSAAVSLAADLIREEVRTRAFARIGASVSIVFAISMVVAPLIAAIFGVPFIFYLTASLSFMAMLYILLFIREPAKKRAPSSVSLGALWHTLGDRGQLVLNASVGVLHSFLVCIFVILPLEFIHTYGFPKEDHWKVYLPIILLSVAIMVSATAVAERKGRTKEVFLIGIALIGVGFLIHFFTHTFYGAVVFLTLYFVGFHLLEPVMPSLLIKLASSETRGMAVGMYNTSQFVGAFIGGLAGGVFLKVGVPHMLITGFLMSVAWFMGVYFLLSVPSRRKDTDGEERGQKGS